jgi:hypothetical protein
MKLTRSKVVDKEAAETDPLHISKQLSSQNVSSDQCDSLGPNTERLLLGSLLGPDEDFPVNTSGE